MDKESVARISKAIGSISDAIDSNTFGHEGIDRDCAIRDAGTYIGDKIWDGLVLIAQKIEKTGEQK